MEMTKKSADVEWFFGQAIPELALSGIDLS